MTKTKNLLITLVLLSVFLVSMVSAADYESVKVNVDGVKTDESKTPAVIAGEDALIKVEFESNVSDKEVTVDAEIDAGNAEVREKTEPFDVEKGYRYNKKLVLRVPENLYDEVSDDITLDVDIGGGNSDTSEEYKLRVQRPTYKPEFMSVSTPDSVKSGEDFPVDVVVKNRGYNKLDDAYVSASIPELGITKEGYFGDIIALENDSDCCYDDEKDTISGRFLMDIPYDVDSGDYEIEVDFKNKDVEEEFSKNLRVENEFPERAIVDDSRKKTSLGEEAEYTMTLVNPTDSLKVYRVETQSPSSVSTSVTGGSVIGVPAGSTKTAKLVASSESSGSETIEVDLVSSGNVEETASLVLETESEDKDGFDNPLAVLTVILAIIFVVLLVVLVVLLTKRTEKSEDFGESYY